MSSICIQIFPIMYYIIRCVAYMSMENKKGLLQYHLKPIKIYILVKFLRRNRVKPREHVYDNYGNQNVLIKPKPGSLNHEKCHSVCFTIGDVKSSPPNHQCCIVTSPDPTILEQSTTQCDTMLSSI
jgi:hypothetical protein